MHQQREGFYFCRQNLRPNIVYLPYVQIFALSCKSVVKFIFVKHVPVPVYKALTFSYMCIESNLRPAGRAVQGVGLRPLAAWYCGFECRKRDGCLSLVSVVYCHVGVSATA